MKPILDTGFFKSLYDLNKIKEVTALIKNELYDHLMQFDLISNFDFVLSNTEGNPLGRFTVDTNTEDLYKQNKKEIVDRATEIYKNQTTLVDLKKYINIKDAILSPGINIIIKFIKAGGYFAPRDHDTGDATSLFLYGALINDLPVSSKFCVDEEHFYEKDEILRKKLKAERIQNKQSVSTACVEVKNSGDDFAFSADVIYTFECSVYTEMLFFGLNRPEGLKYVKV